MLSSDPIRQVGYASMHLADRFACGLIFGYMAGGVRFVSFRIWTRLKGSELEGSAPAFSTYCRQASLYSAVWATVYKICDFLSQNMQPHTQYLFSSFVPFVITPIVSDCVNGQVNERNYRIICTCVFSYLFARLIYANTR